MIQQNLSKITRRQPSQPVAPRVVNRVGLLLSADSAADSMKT